MTDPKPFQVGGALVTTSGSGRSWLMTDFGPIEVVGHWEMEIVESCFPKIHEQLQDLWRNGETMTDIVVSFSDKGVQLSKRKRKKRD